MVKQYLKRCKERLNFKKNEKGAISILSVMFIAVIIFFVFFLVFDYSTYTEKKQQLQYFADNSAAAVAQKSRAFDYPTTVQDGQCATPGGMIINCEIVKTEKKVIFDSNVKLQQITDGIAHQMARKEFNLDENNIPTGDRNEFKSFKMKVDIYDSIDTETTIETEVGTYKVTKPTVVVKVWATIEGPFLGRDIEQIAVGVYEADDKAIGQNNNGSSIILKPSN